MSSSGAPEAIDRHPVSDRHDDDLFARLAVWLSEVSAEAVGLAIDTDPADDPEIGEAS